MQKWSLVVWIVLFCLAPLSAQRIEGVVYERSTKEPLSGVKVEIENTTIWTLSGPTGRFALPVEKGGVLIFSRSGLVEKRVLSTTLPTTKAAVEMDLSSVRIPEVSLSVKKKLYSEIEIKEEALKNIQAFSLNEVLEQLPGQKLQDLNLNEFKPVVFRSALPTTVSNEGFGNKSFGTSIVVDGIPFSNNENMQTYNTNYSGAFSPNSIGFGVPDGRNGYFSNANFGADLREISTDNIEKIEVVQGVASAKYGDMTSGLITIEQKKGSSPLRMYTALREGTTEYNLSKGFSLGPSMGSLTTNLNYLSSNPDPRTRFNQFERVLGSVLWNYQNPADNFENSVSVEYQQNLDDANFDAEDTNEQMTYNKKRNIRISNRLRWSLQTRTIDQIAWNTSFAQGYQFTHDSRLVNVGGDVVGTSLTEGVYTGAYTPVSYRQVKEIEGKPLSFFSSVDLSKRLQSQSWTHHLSLGGNFSLSDNKGRGRLGEPESLQNTFGFGSGDGGTAFRPYNFGQNVRAETQVGLYVEDRMEKRFDNALLNVSLGLRSDYQNGHLSLAPRINSFIIYKNLKLRGGFGLSTKAPSLNMIYTGPRYFDAVLADVRLPGYYNIGVVQTFIDQSDNENLSPSKGMRSEVGMDYRTSWGNLGLTAYYNKLTDGFTSQSYAQKKGLASLEFTYNGTEAPTYEVTGYTDYFFLQSRLVNALSSSDRGLELLSSIQKTGIPNLSMDLQGSWVETVSNPGTDRYFRSKDPQQSEVFGLYRPYDTTLEQLTLGAALNYHLAKAGLILSLRSQHYFIDNLTFYNENLPYAYINRSLEKVLLTPEQIRDPEQFSHIKNNSIDERSDSLDQIYHNINMRITKEFSSGLRFSFYANNFLDLKQTEVILSQGQEIRVPKGDLLTLSFGAKIEYEF